MLVLVGLLSEDFPVSATRVPRLRERKGSEIHAELVLRSRANPRLSIHSSTQVIVQVRTLGHFFEQVTQLQRIPSRGLQVQRPAPLSFALRSNGPLCFGLRVCPRCEKQKRASRATDSQAKRRLQKSLSEALLGWLFHLSSSGFE